MNVGRGLLDVTHSRPFKPSPGTHCWVDGLVRAVGGEMVDGVPGLSLRTTGVAILLAPVGKGLAFDAVVVLACEGMRWAVSRAVVTV